MHTLRATFLTLLTGLLMAILICTPALAGEIKGVTADVRDFKDGHDEDNLVDGDPATAWIGGGRSTGPGKWIELTFPAPVKLKSLSIANGNQAAGQFKKYRRITRGVIKYPDESRQQFTLKPTPGVQTIKLQPGTVGSLKIVILGVAPGSKDKTIGKAKVAVSEITILGEMDESAIVDDVTEKEPIVVEDNPLPKEKSKSPAPKKQPKPEKKAAPKIEAPKKKTPPAVKVKDPKKQAPSPVKVEKKPAPKATPTPKPKAEKPAQKKQVAKAKPAPDKPKKTKAAKTAPKPAPKKAAKKSKPKVKPQPKASGSATSPGIAYLRSAIQVPESKPFGIGKISPWLNLELVAQIKRYLGLITTLHDSYPDVFISPLRDKERTIFIKFQNEMRANKKFGQHHMAQLDHIGLSFDKPVIGDEAATVRVHGPYRYYIGQTVYEFQIDAIFSLMVEGDKWMISSVQAK